jgi:uncharacterized protein (TIGR02001 family)
MKLKSAVLLSTLALSASAFAQTKAPEPDYTLSFNAGVVTDYRYRGISQTRLKPAVQGGLDFAHKSGFYLGAWASTIKWIEDSGGPDGKVELDLYGGYKGELAKGLTASLMAVDTNAQVTPYTWGGKYVGKSGVVAGVKYSF